MFGKDKVTGITGTADMCGAEVPPAVGIGHGSVVYSRVGALAQCGMFHFRSMPPIEGDRRDEHDRYDAKLLLLDFHLSKCRAAPSIAGFVM
jgi:hypothetical protein